VSFSHAALGRQEHQLIIYFHHREFLPLPPKKLLFWFGDEPVETKDLNHYLAKGKEAAHSTAAWASQTGKGLLYFSKTGEKTAPTGVLNLVCVTPGRANSHIFFAVFSVR